MPSLNDTLQDTLVMNAARGPAAVLEVLDPGSRVSPNRPSPSVTAPPNQSIWFWEYDTGRSLTKVTNLEAWSRFMGELHPGSPDLAWLTVCAELEWGPVHVIGRFGNNSLRLELPLTQAFVKRSLLLRSGANDGTNPWWPLVADVDGSFLMVFVYNLTNIVRSSDPPLPATDEEVNDVNFMPGAQAGAVAGGTVRVGEVGTGTLGNKHFVVVCLSLVCTKERADFEPAGVVGMGRIYPHFMIMSSKPLEQAEAEIKVQRPAQTGYFGSFNNPNPPRIMAHADMDANMGSVLFTDTNVFRSVDQQLHIVNMPYWDLIFDYYIVDVTSRISDNFGTIFDLNDPTRVVNRLNQGERRVRGAIKVLDYNSLLNNLRKIGVVVLAPILGPLGGVGGIIAIDLLLSRPSFRMAVPQTPDYVAANAAIFPGGVNPSTFVPRRGKPRLDVVKVDRQGTFDSIHCAPGMKAHQLLAGNPNLSPSQQLAVIKMAPFCEHDCLHTHWRWGKNWSDARLAPVGKNQLPLKGFAPSTQDKFRTVGRPYSVTGNTMVPRNQHVDIIFTNARTFVYRVKINMDGETTTPTPPAIDPGVWQPVFHHGSGYALSIVDKNLIDLSILGIANPKRLAPIPQAGEISELYWNLRFQATTRGPLERIEIDATTLRNCMFA